MKKVLVTGGAGFVGRHLVRALLDMRWEVTVVDDLIEGTGGISPLNGWPLFNPQDYTNFKFIKDDCRNFFKNNSNAEFDYVFHLAAMVGGRLMIENNPLLVSTDLAIDAEMWRWASTSKITKIINFSSSAAYPVDLQQTTNNSVSLREEMISFDKSIGIPDLTYGWAKLTSEYLGKIAWEKSGIKSVVYRPFSGYGADQNLSYPFPSICKRAIENIGNTEFMVWGTGKQARDFIHIDDCIRGILETFEMIDNGDALNLSTGIATSFHDFAVLATSTLNYYPDIVGDSSKPSGVTSRVGNTDKQLSYKFKTKISFKEGVQECINYFYALKTK